jgi:hypothetical protein
MFYRNALEGRVHCLSFIAIMNLNYHRPPPLPPPPPEDFESLALRYSTGILFRASLWPNQCSREEDPRHVRASGPASFCF